ncbi:MAG: hypothetical protein HQK55_05175 [Deltaproteobacteria bacterium]|nr:hypothetical protein [Deltaproteobacteria bacterium]
MRVDPIWSVAPNKLTAKVATRLVKPCGEYIVPAGEEEKLLQPLPLFLLPGFDREDVYRLRDFHVRLAGELGRWSLPQLEVVFGRRSPNIHRLIRGIDPSPVLPLGRPQPTIVVDHEFGEDTNDDAVVEAALYRLAEATGGQLRERNLVARRLILKLDYTDGGRVIRQKSTPRGTANDFKLFAWARTILQSAWQRRVRVRRLHLTADLLTLPDGQLELAFTDEDESVPRDADRLILALDQVRRRFGPEIIKVGRTLEAGASQIHHQIADRVRKS